MPRRQRDSVSPQLTQSSALASVGLHGAGATGQYDDRVACSAQAASNRVEAATAAMGSASHDRRAPSSGAERAKPPQALFPGRCSSRPAVRRRILTSAAGRPRAALRPGPAAVRACTGRRAHRAPVRPAAEPASARGHRRHHRPDVERVQDAPADRPRTCWRGWSMRSMRPAPRSSASTCCSFARRRPTTRTCSSTPSGAPRPRSSWRPPTSGSASASRRSTGSGLSCAEPAVRRATPTWQPSAIGSCGSRRSRRRHAAYPKSFAALLAGGAGHPRRRGRPRIAWLRDAARRLRHVPHHPGRDAAGPADDPLAKAPREGLKDKIVIVGGLLARDGPAPDAADLAHARAACPARSMHSPHRGRDDRRPQHPASSRSNSLVLRLGLAGPGRLRLPDRLALSPEAAGHPAAAALPPWSSSPSTQLCSGNSVSYCRSCWRCWRGSSASSPGTTPAGGSARARRSIDVVREMKRMSPDSSLSDRAGRSPGRGNAPAPAGRHLL